MTDRNQFLEADLGCHFRAQLAIPIGSSGLQASDIEASEFVIQKNGVDLVTKTIAAAELTADDDGEYLLIDLAGVPDDVEDLGGTGSYGWAWYATIDGVRLKRAAGEFRVFA